jgi:hypothetical protein
MLTSSSGNTAATRLAVVAARCRRSDRGRGVGGGDSMHSLPRRARFVHGHCGTPWWRMRIMVLLLSGSKPFCAREVELQLVRREKCERASYFTHVYN